MNFTGPTALWWLRWSTKGKNKFDDGNMFSNFKSYSHLHFRIFNEIESLQLTDVSFRCSSHSLNFLYLFSIIIVFVPSVDGCVKFVCLRFFWFRFCVFWIFSWFYFFTINLHVILFYTFIVFYDFWFLKMFLLLIFLYYFNFSFYLLAIKINV